MGKHKIFLWGTMLQIVILFFLLVNSYKTVQAGNHDALLANKRKLVGALELTDLSIWTEARYTRHPSQADFFTPFQDFPSALDHFPAGSVIEPNQFNADSSIRYR